MSKNKRTLLGLNLGELQEIALEEGMPRFVGKQLAEWLYSKQASDFESMTNLSKTHRERLAQNYETGRRAPIKVSEAQDGTRKYLFETSEGAFVEAVYIPDDERGTLCLSSQAGCRMACTFCATARMGLIHNLSACDILNQFAYVASHHRLTNIVFMGMGEPADNADEVLASISALCSSWGWAWSPRRITLSSAGVTPKLKRIIEQSEVDIAISLHNPISSERAEIMPIERAYPIKDVVEMLKGFDFTAQRRLSFEYILMDKINDAPRHINECAKLLNGLKCRINIIKFHKIPDSPYYSPRDERIISFRNRLTAKGIHTTIRRSRGEEIEAACGLLSYNNTEQAVKTPADTI